MDFLIGGDVGLEKTEVAMQAAFLAVQSGKQVVVLVPTTLLANQHQQNFQDRFSDWPIKIEVMTRLQSTKQHKETLEKFNSKFPDVELEDLVFKIDRLSSYVKNNININLLTANIIFELSALPVRSIN